MPYTIENGFVKIPEPEFQGLLNELASLKEAKENAFDLAVLDQALRIDEENLPSDMVRRMVEGEHPIRAFRQYRALTQQALADKCGVSKTTISELETGRKQGSLKTLSAIAEALNVDIDDLV